MKKTLLLLLFAVFAMGFSANACEIKFYLHDAYGAGWNTNQIKVDYINNSIVQTENMTILDGNQAMYTIDVDDGSTISIDWILNYNDGVSRSFSIKFTNGIRIYESPVLENGYHYEFVLNCSDATKQRSITVNPNPLDGGNVSGSGNYEPMTSVTVSATPNDGFLFNNWSIDDEITATTLSYTFDVDYDYNIIGNFFEYNGLYVGNDENSNVNIPLNSSKKHSVSQQIYTRSGDGLTAGVINSIAVYNNGTEKTRNIDVYMVNIGSKESFDGTKDWISLTADDKVFSGIVSLPQGQWTTIAFNVGENAFTLNDNNNLALVIHDHTATGSAGCEFRVFPANNDANQTLYYLSSLSSINPLSLSSKTGTLLASKNQIVFGYSSMSCTVTATSHNTTYGTVTGGGTYTSGETCTLTATAATGYEFKCWKEANTIVSTDAEYTFTVEGDRTLTAYFGTHWTPIEGNQTTATVKGVVSINGQQQVNPDNVLEVGAFCGDECRAVTRPQYFPPTQEYVVQMSVRSNVLSGETITFRLYNYATMEEYDICPNTIEYVAEAVYGGMGNWFQFAFYTELDITTSVNPENAGIVTGAGSYLYGTQATITATPNEGYVFVNWTKNNVEVSTNPSYTFTVEEAAEYVANFNIVISATANPTAGGTVTGAGNYAYGTTCQLVATNNSGYEFVNWTKGGVEVSTEPSYSFTVEAPGAYVANFNPIEFEINAIVNPAEAGTVSGAGMYMVGTNCTLTATANPGYEFVNWTKDNVEVSTNASLSFTVEGAATYYANFTGKQVTQLVNGWNWWSTAIETDNNSLTVLEETLGHNGLTIKSQDLATENYYQDLGYDYWWGALTMLNNESNYLIQTNAACEVVMTGEYVDPAEHPITIVPNWSWIGYPVNATQEVADAISNTFVPADGDMIKSQGASITYYDGYGWWTSEVINMIPGKGYKYQSNASENKSLTFVNNGNSNSKSGSIDNHYWKSNPYAYADNMVIFATAIVANEEQHDADLELGAFVDGVCRGRTHMRYFEPLNRYLALMTVSGEEGDVIEFGLVNANSNLISLDCSDNVVFESDAIIGSLDEPFEVHFSAMQEFSRSQLEMFPNPVSRNETVTFNLPDDEMVKEVVVTNAVGAVVKHNASSLTMIGEGMPMSGVYMVKVICNSGNVYTGKLIVK